MNILALDTSASWGSVAFGKGQEIVYLSYLDLRVTHSERLMQQIDNCLKIVGVPLEKIDLIAFSNGPGSFTGLRIGLATLKGLSLAKRIPLCPFNTLKVLAANFAGLGIDIMPCIDAKMNEVYAAVYDTDLNEKQPPLSTTLLQMLEQIAEPVIMVGNVANKYRDLITSSGKNIKLVELHQNIPMASAMISLIYRENINISYDASSIAALEPYYLRKSQAEINFG